MNCYDKMNIINLVVLFVFLINVRTITSLCKKNPNCQCFPTIGSDRTKVICNARNNTMFIMEIDPWDTLTITCKNYEGWEDFYFTDRLPGKSLDLLHFKHCGLSDEISLKNVVAQFGVDETNSLIFQSYKNLGVTLKREYIEGFPELKKLILSNNGFTNISKDFFWDCSELEWLDLSQNNLEFSVDIFNATPNLKGIDIGYNGMNVIELGMFDGLEKLEFLSLEGNELTEIKDGIFNHLVSLKILDLSRNNLLELPQNIFHKLKQLENLDLSFNNLSFIPPDLFIENKELQQVLLQDNTENMTTLPNFLLAHFVILREADLSKNGLSVLPENLFYFSKLLMHIILNDNFLITLPRKIFLCLRNLEILEISNNLIKTLPDRIFEDLDLLKKLDLSRNRMVFITEELFIGLDSVTELNLERNQLKYIDPEGLSLIKYLNIAKFSHNQLTLNETGKSFSTFYANEFISELDLSYNNISMYYTDWTLGHYHLRLLNLSHNVITNVTSHHFICPSNSITIDLRYNKLKNISLDLIDELSPQFFDRDVFVYIEHNPLLCDCQLYNLLRYIRNRLSRRVYEFIKFIPGYLTCVKLDGTGETKVIEFEPETFKCYEHDFFKIEPKCQTNCTCWIIPEDKTRIIDCSYKKMSNFWIDEEKVHYVENSSIILNLTGNALTEIPSIKALEKMNLIGLLLSNNNIYHITADKLPRSLKILQLHNNKIYKIDSDLAKHLESITFNELTLSGNPIICDCETAQFVLYVQVMRHLYDDLSSLTCYKMNIPMYQLEPVDLCSSYIFIVTMMIAMVLVLISISGLHYELIDRIISGTEMTSSGKTIILELLIFVVVSSIVSVGVWHTYFFKNITIPSIKNFDKYKDL